GRAPTSFGPAADYLNPMVLVPTQHDLRNKLLLDNVISPAATGQVPRVNISSIATGANATVTTVSAHGLSVGDTITIDGVTGGTFTTGGPINATFQVASVPSTTTFTIPVNCTATAGAAGRVTGVTVKLPNTGGNGTQSGTTPIAVVT